MSAWAGVLYRLGRLCAQRPLLVVAVWLGLVVVVQLVVGRAGAETSNDLSLPGTESQQATDLLADRFPPQQNGSSPVVFHVTKGKITDSANTQAVESSYKALSKAPHVASAPDPFANAASGLVSKDAKTAFTPVLLDIPNGDVTEELAGSILATTAPARKAGAEVTVGGNLGGVLSNSPTESSASAPPSGSWWRPSNGAGGWTWSACRPRTAPCRSPSTTPPASPHARPSARASPPAPR